MTNFASGAIDSRLYRDMFTTPEMRALFSDEATLKGWLDAEAALAQAEAILGIIPSEAARTITGMAVPTNFDLDTLRQQMTASGHPLVATIKALEALCGDAGQHVHYGATTQDIMDTGLVLQLRSGLDLIARQLKTFMTAAFALAGKHKATPICARTHGQQAVPTTFGHKIAVVAEEMQRHQVRLEELESRLLVGALHGAAGTLATLGEDGPAVRAEMMRILDLGTADICRHTARDAFAECVFDLALIAATCEKLANEFINLQRSEIGEVAEPAGSKTVGSSTMPQKRNPALAQSVVAVSRLVRRQVSTMLETIQHEHERDFSAWQSEWAIFPETFIMTSAALDQITRIVSGLMVNTERMRENLMASGGLINAEAVMMHLAPMIGRSQAHHAIADASKAATGSRSFLDCLCENPTITAHASRAELENLLQPEAWLGEAISATERILAKASTS